MSPESLESRLDRQATKVECPICRHRQWLSAPRGRCDQCGSEIALYEDREAAARAHDELAGEGRLVYLAETSDGLYAVIANRAFPSRDAS